MNSLLSRVAAASPRGRKALWRLCYQALALRYRQADWRFMNYGYAELDPTAPPLPLEPADEPDRCAIQLYDQAAGGAALEGRAVLEVGCGRGGGSSYVARYLRPRSMLGVDFSQQAITLCRKAHSHPALEFRQGDAEALPCDTAVFDAVINVESSHCYARMAAFLAEAHRVLRPGGALLWADFRPAPRVGETLREFQEAGFRLREQQDITANVVAALDRVSAERAGMIRRLVPGFLAAAVRDFAGVRGTRVYESLRQGSVQYLRCAFLKPA